MNEISNLWKNYNFYSNLLKEELGRTSNLVGEYAEYLVNEYLGGELMNASNASSDIKAPNGDLHQVKSRKINELTTQLGIIRSWDFNFLTIILFDDKGSVIKGLIYPKSVAEKYAVENKHQNGWVISTTSEFLNEENKFDITHKIRELNNDIPVSLEFKTNKNSKKDETFNQENWNKKNILQGKSEVKIGQYVQQTFKDIINKIDKIELENLQNQDYSKKVFDLQFPFLRKVKKNDTEKALRYWKTQVSIMGEFYFICSEWYEKNPNNDRPYYEKWLNTMKKNSKRPVLRLSYSFCHYMLTPIKITL